MDVLFVVTIDTESDKATDWSGSPKRSFDAVTHAIPERFMPLFERFSVVPTFLLSPEVIENDACVDVLRRLDGAAELGTHLHGEFAEPMRTFYPHNMAGCRTLAMQSSFPPDVERKKLQWLTELFAQKFGSHPKSFRAGRFGMGFETLPALTTLGYMVDTSVTPGMLWSDEGGEADFRNWTVEPKRLTFPVPLEPMPRSIVEIPVTLLPKSRLSGCLEAKGLKRLTGFPARLLRRVGGFRWLRPSFNNEKEMVRLCREVVRAGERGTRPVILNMMLHNVEVVPNASPYARTHEETDVILDRMAGVFQFGRSEGYRFVNLSAASQSI